jgi:hypothetical protein
MVRLAKIYQSGEFYLIENTIKDDDERWFQRFEWDKSNNSAKLIDDYWSESSLKIPPRKVPKAFLHLKKQQVILARIL